MFVNYVAKKRGCGYDIVVEWVPTADPKQGKTKAERELRNDPFSTFFSGIEESGRKMSSLLDVCITEQIDITVEI